MNSFIKRFFSEHPTILLTLSYFLITIIGVIYSYFFYNEFGINIIQFADLSDFLLASILEPLTLLIFIFIIGVATIFTLLDLWLRKRFLAYGDFTKKRLKSKYTDPIAVTLVIGLWSIVVIKSLAVGNAAQIKTGEYDHYQVNMTDTSIANMQTSFALLGSSSRYIYLYNHSLQKTFVIPIENISLLSKSTLSL